MAPLSRTTADWTAARTSPPVRRTTGVGSGGVGGDDRRLAVEQGKCVVVGVNDGADSVGSRSRGPVA